MLPDFMSPKKEKPRSLKGFAAAAAPPVPAKPIAKFPMRKQELPNWCWAAVSSGVATARSTARSQCQVATLYAGKSQDPIVNTALKKAPCCPPSLKVDTWAYLNEVLDLLGLTRVPIRAITAGDGTAAQAKADLAKGRPVPIRIDWNDGAGSGHFIALVGSETRAGAQAFLVYDPAETHEDVGNLLVRSEADLAGGYNGVGEWSHVYFVK